MYPGRHKCIQGNINVSMTTLAIYAPIIYAAPCVMFLMRAMLIHYEGKWEGVEPWISRVFWAL